MVLQDPHTDYRAGLGASITKGNWDLSFIFETTQGNEMWAPSTALDAETNRSIVLPSKIASAAGIDINGKIDTLTFSYVTETYQFSETLEALEECNTTLDLNYEVERIFCKDTITVTNLTLAAIYE
jgi:hypothetical protein